MYPRYAQNQGRYPDIKYIISKRLIELGHRLPQSMNGAENQVSTYPLLYNIPTMLPTYLRTCFINHISKIRLVHFKNHRVAKRINFPVPYRNHVLYHLTLPNQLCMQPVFVFTRELCMRASIISSHQHAYAYKEGTYKGGQQAPIGEFRAVINQF